MSEHFSLPEQSKILQQVSAKSAFRIIVGVSLAALLFLVWLIYWKEGAETSYSWVPYLPALNAAFNSLSTVFLLLGLNENKNSNSLTKLSKELMLRLQLQERLLRQALQETKKLKQS